jgi:hypothetical protein
MQRALANVVEPRLPLYKAFFLRNTVAKIKVIAWQNCEVQISGRFRSDPAVFMPQRRETGRPNPI